MQTMDIRFSCILITIYKKTVLLHIKPAINDVQTPMDIHQLFDLPLSC